MKAASKRMATASFLDALRVVMTVLAPTIAKGVIKRRASMEALVGRRDLDRKAVLLMQRLRRIYGDGPLYLALPFRPQVLLLNAEHVAEVLAQAPTPFSPATLEKRSALDHFEPGNVLISNPARRAELRPLHEHALATGERVHPLVERFRRIIVEEVGELLPVDGQNRPMRWSDFSETWFRIVRRIVLGDGARDDDVLTTMLDDLRRRANWAFAIPTNKRKLKNFQNRLADYLEQPEPGTLISRFPRDRRVEPESQVAQWLFAFDAAGIATFRALALIASLPELQERVHKEAAATASDRRLARAVFLDTVRLWPTTPALLREVTADHQLDGHAVAQGTGLIIFAPFFHRDDERLPYANQLNADLWLNQDAEPSSGLVPFSAGPVICPGHDIVPMLASLAMGALLLKAKIDLIEPAINQAALPGSLDHFEIRLRLTKRTTILQ